MNLETEPLVWLDLETGGTDEERHQITQVAAVATKGLAYDEVGTFERKVQLLNGHYTDEALELQNFDPDVWTREALPILKVLEDLRHWLAPYTHAATSKSGNTYQVAHLAGHNLEFDCRFIRATCKRNGQGQRGFWLPLATWTAGFLDTLQLALWASAFGHHQFADFRLETLCEHFEIHHDAHDAMGDVRATVALARILRGSRSI